MTFKSFFILGNRKPFGLWHVTTLMRERMKTLPRQTLCTWENSTLGSIFFGYRSSHTHTQPHICLFTSISISNASSPSAWCQGCDDTHICSPAPSSLPLSTHGASPLPVSLTLARPLLPTGGFVQCVRVGMSVAQDASLSSPSHDPLYHHVALRRPRLCQWALQYLRTGPTCPHCDIQAWPICLSISVGTSWLDSLHADRGTIGSWTQIHNRQLWLTDLNKQH